MLIFIAAQAPDLRASAEELERVDAFRRRLAVDGRLRLTPKFLRQIRDAVSCGGILMQMHARSKIGQCRIYSSCKPAKR